MIVSFAKDSCKRDDVLQKNPVILRSLLIVATPWQATDGALSAKETYQKRPFKRDP